MVASRSKSCSAHPLYLSALLLSLAPIATAQIYYPLPQNDPLSLAAGVQYPTIIQGYLDPVAGYLQNTSSSPAGYDVYATFPAGTGTPATYPPNTIPGNTTYSANFGSFDSSSLAGGTYTYSVTATDTTTGANLTLSGNVTVLSHGQFAYYNGQILPKQAPPEPENPLAESANLNPQAFGATGGGESASFASPGMLGDPADFGAPLDLDSVTPIGDPEITCTLTNYLDIPDDDSTSNALPFQINVNAPGTGTYYTVFELNYSDEQDIPGADAPGSEHDYFGVEVDVTTTNATAFIVLPEPAPVSLVPLGILFLLLPFVRRSANGRAGRRVSRVLIPIRH
jgi:hypothetical protein